jgi:hypothetical protein
MGRSQVRGPPCTLSLLSPPKMYKESNLRKMYTSRHRGDGKEAAPPRGTASSVPSVRLDQPTLSSFSNSSGDSSLVACLPMRRPREARSSFFLFTGMVMVVTCGSPSGPLSSAKTL